MPTQGEEEDAPEGGSSLMPTRPAIASDTRELAEGDKAPPSDVTTPAEGTPVEVTPIPAHATQARISALPESLNIPSVWLDRLLTLSHELPIDQGESGVVRAIVAEVQILAPSVQVAVRPPSADAAQPSERHVLWTEPPKSDEQERSGRFFPTAAYERSVSLPGGPEAGSIHFASDEDVFRDEAGPIVLLMDRVALVTAQALARVREAERTALLKTDLRTVRSQMVQAEKLASLGQIAAGMVHELNNPLTSIAAYTDYLLRRAVSRGAPVAAPNVPVPPDSNPTVAGELDDAERLRRIAESANRMLRFTRDLVSYARPSTEVPISIEIHAVIDRALAFCEHEIADAGVVVHRAFSDDVRDARGLRGLPEQLAQVFVNLVTNACHAMAPAELPPSAGGRAAILAITTSLLPRARRTRGVTVDLG